MRQVASLVSFALGLAILAGMRPADLVRCGNICACRESGDCMVVDVGQTVFCDCDTEVQMQRCPTGCMETDSLANPCVCGADMDSGTNPALLRIPAPTPACGDEALKLLREEWAIRRAIATRSVQLDYRTLRQDLREQADFADREAANNEAIAKLFDRCPERAP